jgi:hypothetical protein
MHNGGNYGTVCAKVERNGRPRLLHCNHVFGCYENNINQNVLQDDPTNDRVIGQITDKGQNWDWALIKNNGSAPWFTSGVRYSYNGSIHQIGAYFNRYGLKRAMQNNRKILKQGYSSGFTAGTIEGMNNKASWECVDLGSGGGSAGFGLRCSNNCAPGDSGGPIFARGNNGNIVLAGHTSILRNHQYYQKTGCQNTDFWGQVIGMQFFKLANTLDITPAW